jgi:hypothetical protein
VEPVSTKSVTRGRKERVLDSFFPFNRKGFMNRLIHFPAQLACLLLAAWVVAPGLCQSSATEPAVVVLSAPADDETVEGDVRFQWMRTADIPHLQGFEIHVSARRNGILAVKSVAPLDTGRSIALTWLRFRKEVPRHGRYFWYVDALDSSGRRISSEVRSFVIAPFSIKEQVPFAQYAHTVWLGHTYRMKTSEYRRLLEGVDPRAHLMSYGDIAFVFRQNGAASPRLRLEESVRFFSLAGFGLGAAAQYRAAGNSYVSLSPFLDGSVGWTGTGLKSHSSNQTRFALGCEMMFLPRGYVSFFGGWLPMHRIRYLVNQEGLRTFEGRGWEAGIRIIMPRSLLNPVRFLGMEIDWEKVPIEFRFSRVRDRYTGMHLDSRQMGIGLLLP